jgi:hypothetical protein
MEMNAISVIYEDSTKKEDQDFFRRRNQTTDADRR